MAKLKVISGPCRKSRTREPLLKVQYENDRHSHHVNLAPASGERFGETLVSEIKECDHVERRQAVMTRHIISIGTSWLEAIYGTTKYSMRPKNAAKHTTFLRAETMTRRSIKPTPKRSLAACR